MDASTIILGFTGSIASGCTFISSTIPLVADSKYEYFKLSEIIREVLKSEGNNNPTVEDLQNKGNQLRRENVTGYLVKALIEKIKKNPKFNDADGIIIDGIKNESELNTLRQFPYFFLFSVHSDFKTRCERYLADGKFPDKNSFNVADERDRLEKDDVFGQQVKKCNYLSDIIILNNSKFASVDTQGKKTFVTNIYNKYVKTIEDLRDKGRPSAVVSPTIDELCMTTAYSLSRMSSCLKRKVGAIVIDSISSKNKNPGEKGQINSLPVIISSGYNEVPIGSYKCVFHPEFEMCYRDFLQEAHAQKINNCPKCGTELKINIKCPYCEKIYNKFKKYCSTHQMEIEDNFKCSKCGSRVFKEYLPGGKETPGKLLDMCRALHAEENAILNLLKSGNQSNGNLTLYVTTQPCNLCANKIVSAGIKNVVFDEPYPIKEATEILKSGQVNVKRFEGVKSSAYFRLY